MLGDLIEADRDDTATTPVDNTKSSIVFTGDFSFAETVMLLDSAEDALKTREHRPGRTLLICL